MSERWVYTDGVWDLLHPNHLSVMEETLTHGDRLIVGVVSDAMAQRYKRRPVMNEADRLAIVSALRIVSAAQLIDGPLDDGTVVQGIIDQYDPVAVCYAGDSYGAYYGPAVERGIFVRMRRRAGVSTSEVIERILQSNLDPDKLYAHN